MVQVPSAVENDHFDTVFLRSFSDQLSDQLGFIGLGPFFSRMPFSPDDAAAMVDPAISLISWAYICLLLLKILSLGLSAVPLTTLRILILILRRR